MRPRQRLHERRNARPSEHHEGEARTTCAQARDRRHRRKAAPGAQDQPGAAQNACARPGGQGQAHGWEGAGAGWTTTKNTEHVHRPVSPRGATCSKPACIRRSRGQAVGRLICGTWHSNAAERRNMYEEFPGMFASSRRNEAASSPPPRPMPPPPPELSPPAVLNSMGPLLRNFAVQGAVAH